MTTTTCLWRHERGGGERKGDTNSLLWAQGVEQNYSQALEMVMGLEMWLVLDQQQMQEMCSHQTDLSYFDTMNSSAVFSL